MKTNKLISLREQYRASNLLGGISFVSLLSITALLLYLSSLNNFWIWLIAQIALSLVLWSWFSVFHSCGHQSYFKNNTLNAIAGLIASVFVICPFYAWKYNHAAHHKWTGWGDKDPSINEFTLKPLPDPVLKFVDLCRKVFFPIFSISHSSSLFAKSFKMNETINTRKKLWQCALSSLFIGVVYVVLFLVFGTLLIKLMFLAVSLLLITSDLAFISQHAVFEFENSEGKSVLPLSTTKQDAYTRSFRVHPWIDRWVFLNFNLHGAHHLYPNIPHYHLHKIEFKGAHDMHLFEWVSFSRGITCKELFWPSKPLNKNRVPIS